MEEIALKTQASTEVERNEIREVLDAALRREADLANARHAYFERICRAFEQQHHISSDEFMEQFKALNQMYDYGMVLSDDQKKAILNTLVHEFILEPNGEMEIRYKLPFTERQIQDTVETMLQEIRLVRRGGQGVR